MQDLNRIRNDYAHFLPIGRHYLLSQFPALTATGLHVILFLVNDSGNVHLHRERGGVDPKVRFDTAMDQARATLSRITAAYAGLGVIVKPACGSTPVPPP